MSATRVPRRYDATFLACRDYGHAWTEVGIPDRGALRAARTIHRARYGREVECLRCECRRVEWIASDGDVVARHYSYPDGYSVSGGLAKRVARLARLKGTQR